MKKSKDREGYKDNEIGKDMEKIKDNKRGKAKERGKDMDKGKDKEDVHSLREIILYCNMFQRRDVTKAFRAPALWLIE